MRLKEDISIRKVGDEYLLVSKTLSGLDYTRVISLNASAVFLIEAVKDNDFELEDWQKMLVEKYNIDSTAAYNDALKLVEGLKQAGCL